MLEEVSEIYTEKSIVLSSMRRVPQSTILWRWVALPFRLTMTIAQFCTYSGLCFKTNKYTGRAHEHENLFP
jgi:hypothetical protein